MLIRLDKLLVRGPPKQFTVTFTIAANHRVEFFGPPQHHFKTLVYSGSSGNKPINDSRACRHDVYCPRRT